MIDDLIEFRAGYLRLVAYHWATGNVQNGDDLWGFLAPDIDPTKKHWNNLDIKAGIGGGPEWLPVEASGWSGHHAMSSLDVYLPLQPRKTGGGDIKDELWAFALADFYNNRPDGVFQDRSLPKPPPPPPNFPGVISTLPSGLGDFQTFLEFGAFLLRVVALAWNKPEFRGKVDASAGGNSEAALQAWMGWNSPWNMHIHIRDDEGITYGEPEDISQLNASPPRFERGTWKSGKRNVLTLNLPTKPAGQSEKLHAVALTTYNNTGDPHPFTCCA